MAEPCSTWVRETAHPKKVVDLPVQKSGLKFREKGRGKNQQGSFGYMLNSMNSVQDNATTVGLFSLAYSDAHGLHLFPDNFLRATMLLAARACIMDGWLNDKDEYLAPRRNNG